MRARLALVLALALPLAGDLAADPIQQPSRSTLTSPTLSNPTISGTVSGSYTFGGSRGRIYLGSSGAVGSLCAIPAGGVITTAVGNVGGGEDNLMTYTLQANTLDTNGSFVRITSAGTRAAGTITPRTYIGGSSDLSGANGVTATWVRVTTIIRLTATTQESITLEFTESTMQGVVRRALTEDLTTDLLIRQTGQSSTAGDNDVVQRSMIVEVCRVP